MSDCRIEWPYTTVPLLEGYKGIYSNYVEMLVDAVMRYMLSFYLHVLLKQLITKVISIVLNVCYERHILEPNQKLTTLLGFGLSIFNLTRSIHR
jgi:hypothetical protein